MSVKYSAERIAELQRVLVTEYLELSADTDAEPNPDALRACAMLLAGAAELRDPPEPLTLADPPALDDDGPEISFDGARPTLPTETLIEVTPPEVILEPEEVDEPLPPPPTTTKKIRM